MRLWLLVVPLAMFPSLMHGQANGRTTHAGVYSGEQASRGQEVYVAQCRSCHTLDAHSSATRGRPSSGTCTARPAQREARCG